MWIGNSPYVTSFQVERTASSLHSAMPAILKATPVCDSTLPLPFCLHLATSWLFLMFLKNVGSCFASFLSTVSSNIVFELLVLQASEPHPPFTGSFLGVLLPVTSALLSLALSHMTLVESLHTSCPSPVSFVLYWFLFSSGILVFSGFLFPPSPFVPACGYHRESCDWPLTFWFPHWTVWVTYQPSSVAQSCFLIFPCFLSRYTGWRETRYQSDFLHHPFTSSGLHQTFDFFFLPLIKWVLSLLFPPVPSASPLHHDFHVLVH